MYLIHCSNEEAVKARKSVLHNVSILDLILEHLEKNSILGIVEFRDFWIGVEFEPGTFHFGNH